MIIIIINVIIITDIVINVVAVVVVDSDYIAYNWLNQFWTELNSQWEWKWKFCFIWITIYYNDINKFNSLTAKRSYDVTYHNVNRAKWKNSMSLYSIEFILSDSFYRIHSIWISYEIFSIIIIWFGSNQAKFDVIYFMFKWISVSLNEKISLKYQTN